jgi:hypothetical protein
LLFLFYKIISNLKLWWRFNIIKLSSYLTRLIAWEFLVQICNLHER